MCADRHGTTTNRDASGRKTTTFPPGQPSVTASHVGADFEPADLTSVGSEDVLNPRFECARDGKRQGQRWHIALLLEHDNGLPRAPALAGKCRYHCLSASFAREKLLDSLSYLSALQTVQSEQLVRILIENGADVNAASLDGKTPLILAEEEGHQEIVQLLKSRGAR